MRVWLSGRARTPDASTAVPQLRVRVPHANASISCEKASFTARLSRGQITVASPSNNAMQPVQAEGTQHLKHRKTTLLMHNKFNMALTPEEF